MSPATASKESLKDTIAYYEGQADPEKPSGRYYQDPNDGNEFNNFKKALGTEGLKSNNISKRYNKLEVLLKAFDGNWDTLIRSEELLSKNDLQRISTTIESDPFLLSVQKNDPLYIPITQLKSLLRNNNPNLSMYKVLQRAYDSMGVEAPAALKQIQPSLDQLSPSQTRFVNNLLNGSATRTQIRRMTTPVAQLPLRPSKGYIEGRSGYKGSTEVVSVGNKDASGRDIKLAPNAAAAWKQMIAAGMPVTSSDITSVYRDEQEFIRLQNAGYKPAAHGHHNFGEAVDAHGAVGAWIRQNGAKYGWYPNDYPGSHGGHYEYRGVQ